MKNLCLLLLILLIPIGLKAQEVAIEQTIQGEVNSLRVESGWLTSILPSYDSLWHIAIVTVDSLEERALSTPLCQMSSQGTLTILTNTTLPHSTIVEFYAPHMISNLVVESGATLLADTLQLQHLTVKNQACLHASTLISPTDTSRLILHPNGEAHIRTLDGKAYYLVDLYPQGDFTYEHITPTCHLAINLLHNLPTTEIPHRKFLSFLTHPNTDLSPSKTRRNKVPRGEYSTRFSKRDNFKRVQATYTPPPPMPTYHPPMRY